MLQQLMNEAKKTIAAICPNHTHLLLSTRKHIAISLRGMGAPSVTPHSCMPGMKRKVISH